MAQSIVESRLQQLLIKFSNNIYYNTYVKTHNSFLRPKPNPYTAFLQETYDTIKTNYWQKIEDQDLIDLCLAADSNAGKSRLYTKKLAQDLSNTVANIDPATEPPFLPVTNTPRLNTLILDLRDNIGGAIDGLPYFLGPFIREDQYAYQLLQQGQKEDFKTQTGWLLGLVKFKSVFLVHHLTLREDGQPIEGQGVNPDVNIQDSNWQQQLFAYFSDPSLIVSLIPSTPRSAINTFWLYPGSNFRSIDSSATWGHGSPPLNNPGKSFLKTPLACWLL